MTKSSNRTGLPRGRGILPLILLLLLVPWLRADEKAVPERVMGMRLLFADDFESGAAARWDPGDTKAWRVEKEGEKHVFSLFRQSDTKPPVRSPVNLALVRGAVVSDFVLEADLRSTTRDYPHRDLCLFFGYQNPSHFYYVHLGKRADPNANSIFLVNGAPRVSIAAKRTDGTDWDDNWHRIRIVRRVASGSIEVFFDDMTRPVMTAEDRRFVSGQVGVGSFDDLGSFDNIRLWGLKAVQPGTRYRF